MEFLMTRIFARRIFTANGWRNDSRVTIADGQITALESEVFPNPRDQRVDVLLPAVANLHSHSFQRAMAGMTEYTTGQADSFWTWRVLMYKFLDHLTPEHVEAIAALAFMEMLEAGFASVGEFHYLHHQPGGTPYSNLAELSDRIYSAAHDTGIGLTHLPVLYSYGGAGQKPLAGGQLRFGNELERFNRLVEHCRSARHFMPGDTNVGIAPHSLRATVPAQLEELAKLYPDLPKHMHVAEQQLEVDEVIEWLGARPIEWMLGHVDPAQHWCFIHATQMVPKETEALARSGVVAGLCPVTESNLGDGIFDGKRFMEAGGTFGIGLDSNVSISLARELSTLEYSQRLRDRARNVLAGEADATGRSSVGSSIYAQAARGGAAALGRNSGTIAVGKLADLVAINGQHHSLAALGNNALIDGFIFATPDRVITDVWSAGRHVVVQGVHGKRDAIIARYQRAIAELTGLI
jgi:formimidoylglutamate deiminase